MRDEIDADLMKFIQADKRKIRKREGSKLRSQHYRERIRNDPERPARDKERKQEQYKKNKN